MATSGCLWANETHVANGTARRSMFIGRLLAKSQKASRLVIPARSEPSIPATAKIRLSAEKDNVFGSNELVSVPRRAKVTASHSRMRCCPIRPNHRPSGEKLALAPAFTLDASVRLVIRLRPATSNTRRTPCTTSAVARFLPSGENVTVPDQVWLVHRMCVAGFGSRSQTLTVPSELLEITELSSG